MMGDTALSDCAAEGLQAGDAGWGDMLMLSSKGWRVVLAAEPSFEQGAKAVLSSNMYMRAMHGQGHPCIVGA